jgi:hypothetical protein
MAYSYFNVNFNLTFKFLNSLQGFLNKIVKSLPICLRRYARNCGGIVSYTLDKMLCFLFHTVGCEDIYDA